MVVPICHLGISMFTETLILFSWWDSYHRLRAITWLAIVINTAVVTLMTDPWSYGGSLPYSVEMCKDGQKGILEDVVPPFFRMCRFLFGLVLT